MNRRSNARGTQAAATLNPQQNIKEEEHDSSNGNNQQQEEQPPQVDPPAPENNSESKPSLDSGDDSEEGPAAKLRKFFANRTMNMSQADRKRLEKERKVRQLRSLHKLLTPKNAVVALRELQGPGMSDFTINSSGKGTTAEFVVNNVRYEATAPNKQLAKSLASEKALRDLVIAQMAKARQNAEKQAAEKANGNTADDDETKPNEDEEMTEATETDGVPMQQLASFALYKLFNEWQNAGFDVPAIKPPKGSGKVTEAGTQPLPPKVPKTIADLPADAASRHPSSLLAFMRSHVPYEDLGMNTNPNVPNEREFSVGVTVDGQSFVGKARTKKMARKEAAAEACRSLFNVQFVETSAA